MAELTIKFQPTWNLSARRNAIQKGVNDIKGHKLKKIQLQKGTEKLEYQGTQMQEHVLKTAEYFIVSYE